MKTAAMGMVGVLLLTGGLSAQKALSSSVRNGESFTGEITDSLCAQDGHHVKILKTERGCILTCVRFDAAEFVLYNSETKRTYKLDDQRKPEPFAGEEVTTSGTYDKETNAIHVTDIRPRIILAVSPGRD